METINNNLDLPWDFEFISLNPNLTIEFIDNNPKKPFNWIYISSNNFKMSKLLRNSKQQKITRWWKKNRIKIKTKRLIAIKQLLNQKLNGNKDIVYFLL